MSFFSLAIWLIGIRWEPSASLGVVRRTQCYALTMSCLLLVKFLLPKHLPKLPQSFTNTQPEPQNTSTLKTDTLVSTVLLPCGRRVWNPIPWILKLLLLYTNILDHFLKVPKGILKSDKQFRNLKGQLFRVRISHSPSSICPIVQQLTFMRQRDETRETAKLSHPFVLTRSSDFFNVSVLFFPQFGVHRNYCPM